MKIVVDDVEADAQRGQWRVAIMVTDDAGRATRYLHVFPVDTMEWRAAEYGISPDDTATLLDLVLVEPHLTAEDWSAGHLLFTAPDIDTARNDHLARCAKTKLRCRLSTRGNGSPLQRIISESPLDPDVIAVKEQITSAKRGREMRMRAADMAMSGKDRADALRRQFFGPEPAAKEEGAP